MQYFGLAHVFGAWVSQTDAGEAYANLRQRNHFATLTSIGLVAMTGWLAQLGIGARVPWWATSMALLLALGNAASGSRTGLLQWLLVPILAAWWALAVPGGRRGVLVFVLKPVLAYATAFVALPWLLMATSGIISGGLLGRFAETPGCASRLVLWSNVLTLIVEKPWFGWGWGELSYAHFITDYPGVRFCEILDNAHNLPLHLAVMLGIPAAFTLCAGLGWLVLRARPWRETDPARQMAWGVLAVIMLHSMLEYPLWYGPFQMALGLCVWLLWRSPAKQEDHLNENPKKRLGVSAGVAAVLMATTAYVAWDYHRISQIYLAPQARDAAYRDDTMNKVRRTWLFRNQVRFAELTTTPLTQDNAQWTFDTAAALLHFSPEPRVIEKVIESAAMLGREDEALAHFARYRAAFPQDHESWAKAGRPDDGQMR